MKLITKEGNIKRYINSNIVDEFKENQIAYVGYPSGYGHGKRVSNIAFTLTAEGVVDQVYKDSNLRIRKLTPKECWRLMGFPDEAFERASKVNSNAQLYKQAGNSIVVPVLEHILYELLKRDDCKSNNRPGLK